MSDRKREPPYTSEYLILVCVDCPDGVEGRITQNRPWRCYKASGETHRIMNQVSGELLAEAAK